MTQEKLPPNEGQQAAIDGFFQFLLDPSQSRMILSGPGGTGKTFTMGHMIDTIIPKYEQMCELMGTPVEYDEVVMTATTNKAVEALSKATGRPAQTIQSFLALRVKENYTTGKTELIRTKNWKSHSRKIIFIDECSMIDASLWQEIQDATMRCKVVYVGDHIQLPPVKETLSKLYAQNHPMFELTVPMRTDVPELQALNNQFREVVKTGVYTDIQVVPGIIDWLDAGQAMADIAGKFTNQNTSDRILCYSNPQVIGINDYIRADLRNQPMEYMVGERLVSNSAYQQSREGSRISIEDEVVITELSPNTQVLGYPDNGSLEVRFATLQNAYGDYIERVPLAVDRNHLANLIKYYSSKKDWHTYFELKELYPDLRQRDAATVHKSQGSSYDTVYVDMANISTCHMPGMAARLFYVAFSRARHRVVMFGQLNPKFGKIIF